MLSAKDSKFTKFLTLSCMVLSGVLVTYIPTHADIIFQSDYESGRFSGWSDQWFCCSYSGQIVPSPARAGKFAARFELYDTDPMSGNGTRSAVQYQNNRIGKVGGADEWYGFSTYFPSGYQLDTYAGGANELVAQWHVPPDTGEVWRSPVLAWYTGAGKWQLYTRYSSKPIQTSNDGTLVLLWEAPYQMAVWTDWVVHVKWSYQSNGFIEIWKDGKKIVDYRGPNCYNDQSNIFFQWGIYKWPWNNNGTTNVSNRIVYNDELRIGDANSSYAEVAPRIPDTIPPSSPTLVLGLKP